MEDLNIKWLMFLLLGILLSVLSGFVVQYSRTESGSRPEKSLKSLVIGIMSARENFAARKAIRHTWLKEINNSQHGEKVDYKFIVGRHGCNIHPANRKDLFSCEKLGFLLNFHEGLQKDHIQLLALNVSRSEDARPQLVWNASIVVRHPAVVKFLGLSNTVKLMDRPITVEIFDESRAEVVVSTKFSRRTSARAIADERDASGETSLSGYIYRRVKNVLLPKYFEGTLRVYSVTDVVDLKHTGGLVSVDSAGGVIEINPIDLTGAYIYSDKKQKFYVGNMMLEIFEKDKFRNAVENEAMLDSEYLKKQFGISSKLYEESEKHNDILFVDVVDTYRSLPAKLVEFHKWVSSKFDAKFAMKTDDDCFVNLAAVLKELKQFNKETKNLWWGNFRDNWYVERTGKWAERWYRASEYPSFACGSGNIVSKDLSDWLTKNSDSLFHYQGEDTSSGIWLSVVRPDYVDDQRWLCEKGCDEKAFVIPQLTNNEIEMHWGNKIKCGNICGCTM